jgi:exopolysaccharide biosynthesis WecB/TagA/CpsF family protein
MNMEHLSLLFSRLSRVASEIEEGKLLDRLSSVSAPTTVGFVNAHALNLSRQDLAFFDSLCSASFLLRDGIGVSILLMLFGISPGINSNGTDLIPKLLQRFVGKRVAICGTSDDYLARAAIHVQRSGCLLVLACDGYQTSEHYLETIRGARPDIVVLGMGMPKQEQIAQYLASRIDFPVTIVCGGAILDRWAGRISRAPVLIRQLRAEWLFRLVQEPGRLWRRYTMGVISFLVWAVRMRISHLTRSGQRRRRWLGNLPR